MFVFRALREALRQAAEHLGATPEQAEVLQCDRFATPTDIARFIVETIPTCHALVGDVSYINVAGEERTRQTPNPNAMFEVGVATQCLGPGKVILVFNTDSGGPANLPFDVRNHVVLTWSSSDPPARLAHALRDPVETVFRDYLVLVHRLTEDLDRCFGPLLRFLESFMLRHVEAQRPGFTAEFMALFTQDPDRPVLLPQAEHVARMLREYQRQFLGGPSTVEGNTEGNLFAILLRRLHHDGERLAYRYRQLRGSEFFGQVERVGAEAEHLERLIERVVNRVPDLMVNEIIVGEILGFLHQLVEVRRQVVRWASMRSSPATQGT
jgi:hypothetical protein